MSPLWRDRLRFVLSPDGVTAVRLARGLRPSLAAKARLRCVGGTTPPWAGALKTLTEGLLGRAPWRDAPASVVLSNHFLRYQLLPWSDEIGSEQEWLAYARQNFMQVHGAPAQAWAIQLDTRRRGRPTLACAVDQALLDGLDASCAAAAVRLVSVEPALAAAVNRLRASVSPQPAWFVMVENGRLLVALAQDDGWQLVTARRAAADVWAEELPALLERERRVKGIAHAPERVYVFAPEDDRPALPAGLWRFEWLRPALPFGLSAEADAPYALAMP